MITEGIMLFTLQGGEADRGSCPFLGMDKLSWEAVHSVHHWPVKCDT